MILFIVKDDWDTCFLPANNLLGWLPSNLCSYLKFSKRSLFYFFWVKSTCFVFSESFLDYLFLLLQHVPLPHSWFPQCPLPVLYFLFSKIIVLSKILYHLTIYYNYHLLILSCWKHVNFIRGNLLICFVPWYIPETSSTSTKYLVKIIIQDT